MALQHLLAETCTNLADSLIGFGFCVITRQQEGTIHVGAFSLPIITPNNNEI